MHNFSTQAKVANQLRKRFSYISKFKNLLVFQNVDSL